jgi:hypothetical protein
VRACTVRPHARQTKIDKTDEKTETAKTDKTDKKKKTDKTDKKKSPSGFFT